MCVLVKVSLTFTSSLETFQISSRRTPARTGNYFGGRILSHLMPGVSSGTSSPEVHTALGSAQQSELLAPRDILPTGEQTSGRDKQFSHKSSLYRDKIWRNISPWFRCLYSNATLRKFPSLLCQDPTLALPSGNVNNLAFASTSL